MSLVAMTHASVAGTAYADSVAFTTVYQPLGWTLVSGGGAPTLPLVLEFQGAWSGAQEYKPGDTVTYGGSTFIALTVNTAVTPGTDAQWGVISGAFVPADIRARSNKTLTSLVSTSNYGLGQVATVGTGTGTARVRRQQLVDAADIRLVYVNAFNGDTPNAGTDTDGLSTFTISAGVEVPGDNLLTANQASLETDTTGWAAGAGTTISRSTLQAADGAASLLLSGAGDLTATTPQFNLGTVVTGSTTYTAMGSFRAASGPGRLAILIVNWYDAAGTPISGPNVNTVDNASGWTVASGQLVSPSNAAFAALVPYISGATGEGHYVDKLALMPGTTSIWRPGGTAVYPVTFGGRSSGVIDPGGILISDSLGVELVAGQTWWERTYISAAGGSWNPTTLCYGGGGLAASVDLSHSGAPVAPGAAWVYCASAVVGTPTARTTPSVLIVGDSIAAGFSDLGDGGGGQTYANFSTGGGASGGFVVRALTTAGIPWLSIAHSGGQSQYFNLPAGHVRRLALANGCTHAICNFGFNDLHAGLLTAAALEAQLLATWALLVRRGMKVTQTTLTPYTTSTDGFSTPGSQTTFSAPIEAIRVAVNAWIRGGAPTSGGAPVAVGTSGALLAGQTGHPLSGYFEVADLIESARDSGKWKVAPTVAIAGISVISNTVTVTTSTPHGAVAGDRVWIAGVNATFNSAGTAPTVTSTPSTTSFTFSLTTGNTTVGAGGTVALPYTLEGVHPSTLGHKALVAAVDPARFVLPATA